ncbi:proton-conducting transporter membrane subunit [Pyrobaculum aerophilum]|uniref:proton-conducting transporter transmembrane domain-containing protein n=1 Tax=Pyrobaculum aerophilum TaxID=13773 RepID=UPI0023F07514|nr:proton-conducting transporter membrane subunit [Pyrobaculum aerophilum]MCX8136033.1 proton-conducting transporter membrane subunit [Pyrobaculum aerophilum]
MIDLIAYLVLALSLAAPAALKIDGRYIAVVASLALLILSAFLKLPIGVVVSLIALSLSIDWRLGTFGLALAFSAVATVLAAYVYYAAQPVVYGLIALALVTAAVYGLLAMGRARENVEGAAKYLVFSGVGKVLIVLGYVLGVSGLPQGLYITILGFMFELGIAPFHAWVVDAYALSSPRGAAALAAFSKVTALFVLLSIFRSASAPREVGLIALIVALVSMLVANVAGLTAKTLGRIMAYSSIAHMSYALAAVALVWWLGEPANSPNLFGVRVSAADLAVLVVVLEALASGLAKAGVFGYLSTYLSDLSPPRRSVLNVLNVLSLLGLPPLLGFWPKLFLVLLILAYPQPWLAAFLVAWVVLNSALATPYYLRAIRIIAEAPGPLADNVTSSYTALATTALGLVLPLIAYLLL